MLGENTKNQEGHHEKTLYHRPDHKNPGRGRDSGKFCNRYCPKYGIFDQTIYRWRQKYRGFSASEAKRLKALEEENARLKRLLAEKELEILSASLSPDVPSTMSLVKIPNGW